MAGQRRRIPPAALLAGTLVLLIASGAVLLRLPVANERAPLGWLDAIFTATSAACVTGLVVTDTNAQFSKVGETILLILMQFGGIGVMTIGTMIFLALGARPTPALRAVLQTLSPHRPSLRVRDVLGMVALTTAGVELAGAALLLLAFAGDHPLDEAVWLAVFHSVSAFCNAGFGLWSDSLTRYAGDPLVNLTVMGLIISGGIGFVVLVEMRHWAGSRWRQTGAVVRLSVHAKIMIVGTVMAIAGGAIAFAVLESRNVLAQRPLGEQVLVPLFQSVTTRTAGFNTVDTGLLTAPTLLFMIVLMFMGGGSGSAAGGVKVTTAAAVTAMVIQRLRGRRDVTLFGRAIGELTIQRAVVLAFLASILVGAGVIAIELARSRGALDLQARGELLSVIFEAVSAFGTVGLSMGITADIGGPGKAVLIFLMFAGRLGPLTLMDFFERLPPPPNVRYAREELIVG